MSVTITSDLSQHVDWTVREKTDAALTLNITNNAVAYDISTYTFIADFFKIGTNTPFLTLSQGSGITNAGATGVLTLLFTDTQLTITPEYYFWKLRTTAPTDNVWFNGIFKVNDFIWDGATSSTSTISLTIGSTALSVALSVVTSGELLIGTYSTVLTFDSDYDIYKDATGLSITFTLGTNNINGKGIFLRLNKPTAVTFPGTFEADAGSAALDATKLNVYLLLFFTNWNGSGLDHVIYKNAVYTAQ